MANQYNLSKRGKYWVPDFCLEGERVHRSTKCTAKPDAIKRCDAWAQEIKDRHDGKIPAKQAPTLAEAFRLWGRVQAGQVGELHVVNMRCAVETHAADYLETRIDQIDNLAIMEIRAAYLTSDGVGYRTGQNWKSTRKHTEGGANSVVKMLSALMGWCVGAGLIAAPPFKVKKRLSGFLGWNRSVETGSIRRIRLKDQMTPRSIMSARVVRETPSSSGASSGSGRPMMAQ